MYYLAPSWMNKNDWLSFYNHHITQDGIFICQGCGGIIEPQDFSVDHIIPRLLGGTDDLSNLQPMHRRCNSSKGTKPDEYWNSKFYFDQKPNVVGFRPFQRQIYYKIIEENPPSNNYRRYFLRPFSQISGCIHYNIGIVGVGKTLSLYSITCGINHIRNDYQTAMPRIDRVLVLTKDQDIRDQMASELRGEPVDFGIFPYAPKVGIVENGKQWNLGYISQYDIVVTCVHQFFQQNGQDRIRNFDQVLSWFPCIIGDEIHFASTQINQIVSRATESIFFGSTATNIDAKGNILNPCVKFNLYTYDDANIHDKCLKWVPENINECLVEIETDSADILTGIGPINITDTKDSKHYNQNIRPALSVVSAAIEHVQNIDREIDDTQKGLRTAVLADHRDPNEYKPDLFYPPHVLFKTDQIETTKIVTFAANQKFESSKAEYPPDRGYRMSINHSADKELNIDMWLRYKKDGQIGDRFLTVVDRVREGTNNPYCLFLAYCTSIESVQEAVQRIGRTIRAVTAKCNGVISCPPDYLDTIKIFTHAVYNNREVLEDAIHFIRNMSTYYEDMVTIDDLMNGENAHSTQSRIVDHVPLSEAERVKIISDYGQSLINGNDLDIGRIFRDLNVQSSKRQERIIEFIDQLKEAPDRIKGGLRIKPELDSYTVVIKEYLHFDPTKDEIINHIIRHFPESYRDHEGQMPKIAFDMGRESLKEHRQKFAVDRIEASERISDIQHRIAYETEKEFENIPCDKPDKRSYIYKMTMAAMKRSLADFPSGKKLENNSEFDIPEVHALFQRDEMKRQIKGWVRYYLIVYGYVPTLAKALRIETNG